MNVHGIRRNMKNVVRNYSDAQVKVREATSNDPWGPPSTLMGEIADLSYNVVAFTEIMQMIWKRLNDHGKNWRHVYKALVLLEYLIKTGSEKVGQQCKENIFAIQTLKDFQHTEDNKDQGVNVREKSKQLVALLKDDERLRAERTRALKAKERFAQATARIGSEALAKYGSSGRRDSLGSDTASPRGEGDGATGLSSELECARPQTAGEEELQLQLALAMSKEEAEQEERLRKNDDLRLQMALSESQHNAGAAALHNGATSSSSSSAQQQQQQRSGLDDLLGLSLGATGVADPWGMALGEEQKRAADPWASPTSPGVVAEDPWQSPTSKPVGSGDPWSGHPEGWRSGGATNGGDLDEFDILSKRSATTSPISDHSGVGGGGAVPDAFALGGLRGALAAGGTAADEEELARRRTPESFLGPNSNLVNLDALVTTRSPAAGPPGMPAAAAPNPFALPLSNSASVAVPSPALPSSTTGNPFQASKPPPPTINQLRSQNSAFPPPALVAPQQPRVNPAAFPMPTTPQQNPFI